MWVEKNTSYSQPKQNIWNCKYHRKDTNADMCLTILVFDLYIDKTQIKDARFKNKF